MKNEKSQRWEWLTIPSKGFVDDLRHACIQAGLNARDFCGNEREAIIFAAKERGVSLSDSTIFQIIIEVDKEWVKAAPDQDRRTP